VAVPRASSPDVRRRMERQRRAGTRPEWAIRRLVHAGGLRYLVDAPLPVGGTRRRADLLFRGAEVAVFVDGCFWHACPDHATKPKANESWWAEKLAANVARDRDTDRLLTEHGWTVVRVWEHEDPAEAANRIMQTVRLSPRAARPRQGLQ
jgi:DNA mismatch endonuclease (patch repair protein)